MKPVKLFEQFINEADDLEMLKLMNKAMKAIPGSAKQKAIIKDLNVLRSKNGLEPLRESFLNEAKSKLFAALEKSGKLTQPSGGASMNGKYYQLEGGTKYDIIHFDWDPKSKKPFGVVQVAGHHMPTQILNKLGFRETRSWTAGVEVYIFDGNYNPTWLTEDQMSELVDGWSKGFGQYAKSISDFYKKRGKTSGTID